MRLVWPWLERHMATRYGDDLVDHHTYVIAGDGCLMEGVSHEAASMAGHMKLGRLIVLFDDNGISIDGSTDLSTSDDTTARFEAYGWQVLSCDGHDMDAVSAAITTAKTDPRPSIICCKTIIGFGAPNKQGTSSVHGAPLGDAEIALARETLNWPHPAFEIPADILSCMARGWVKGCRRAQSLAGAIRSKARTLKAFTAAINNDFDQPVASAILAWKEQLASEPQKIATRVASQKVIEAVLPACPTLFGGSADLTGSNNTRVADHSIFITRITAAPISITEYANMVWQQR